MATGPGPYDDICTELRERLEAKGIILVVFGGIHGEGFSCQADIDTLRRLPRAIEIVAHQMRQDIKNI